MTEHPQTFDHFVALADRYFETAAWEEASRALDAADAATRIISKEQLIALDTRRGHIERRKGNYQQAVRLLVQALAANTEGQNLTHVDITCELGNIYMKIDFIKARDLLLEALQGAEQLSKQADLHDDLDLSISAKVQACRAVGKLGMTKYHIATTAPVRRHPLLEEAIDDLERRVQLAESLQHQLERYGDRGNHAFRANVMRILGLGRLALCYTALHQHEQALQYVRAAAESASRSTDPLVQGLIRFYHGMRSLRSRFDRHDEVGYTALDYAVLADDPKCTAIVTRSLRDEMDSRFPDEEAEADRQVAIKLAEAHRRKQYRDIFQLAFRPILAKTSSSFDSDARLYDLRVQYTIELKTDLRKRELFDKFRSIPYSAFKSLGRLPKPSNVDDMAGLREHLRAEVHRTEEQLPAWPYIVFFSYEWRRRRVGRLNEPDDNDHTQYNRMVDAVELLLENQDKTTRTRKLTRDRVFIWLDVASIDQNNQVPGAQGSGVSALPLVVTLCNTVISLVDDSYFSRAWCAVEALLMQSLVSYGHHAHLEHHAPQLGTDKQQARGTLIPSRRLKQLQDVATNDTKYAVTKLEDRASIRFLARQAQLLEKL
ncbi:hypothetical protein B0A48_09884 [Cryoendolithus antarcticus]|uniref:Uncharacterized protein n=1 Tax=Cryoendolithus antarcticus TaxID=1507870 RepID=A0A1V8T390_9PEZI|nr:hypothetical protein B0A48_09884 [Cryoendolithus antarcticus]